MGRRRSRHPPGSLPELRAERSRGCGRHGRRRFSGSSIRPPATSSLASRASVTAWEATQYTGYGEAVRLIAREVYGLDSLTAEGLEAAQRKLEELRRPGERLRLLREVAGLDHVQIDDFRWACKPDESGPDFFLYDLSWANFASGDREGRGASSRRPASRFPRLEDLREAMAALFQRYGPARSPSRRSTPTSAPCAGRSGRTRRRRARWRWCWPAARWRRRPGLPWATGAGRAASSLRSSTTCRSSSTPATTPAPGNMPIDWVRAGNLCPLLARYPEARFVLMHIAYPYSDELVAIAKHYPNVWVDLCWAWSIDPYSSADFVRRFLHAVPSNKLFGFGGDTCWPTAASPTRSRRAAACSAPRSRGRRGRPDRAGGDRRRAAADARQPVRLLRRRGDPRGHPSTACAPAEVA